MSNINNLTSKILKDAEEKKEGILVAANEEKVKILKKRTNEAKSLEAEILKKSELEAVRTKERVISSAELAARNEKLKAKQEIIKEVFEKSILNLSKLDKEQYISFVKNGILQLDISGDEKLILNEEGKKIIDSSLLEEINKELSSKGKKGNLTISSEVANFKGGFILEKGGIEINSTFEALVNSLKEELEFKVAKELFN